MGKIRNPLDALKNPKEAFQHPLRALPFETKGGELQAFGNKGGASTESGLPDVSSATPPATRYSREAMQAGMDLRQQELMRKNIRSTVKAGDTGGFKRPATVRPAGGNPLVAPQGKY